MVFIRKNSKKILVISLIILILMLSVFLSRKGKLDNKELVIEKKEEKAAPDIKETDDKVVQEEILKVDVKGEVITPGVYEFNKNDRVIDILTKAGGLTENADTSNINLSKRVIDEMVIIVYSKEEITNNDLKYDDLINEQNNIKNEGEVDAKNNLISINTASKEELMSLNGIGESKANSIIDYRTKQRFNTIDDIKQVSGIGDSLFEKIKNYITV